MRRDQSIFHTRACGCPTWKLPSDHLTTSFVQCSKNIGYPVPI
jgi:hypothetical protein